MKHFRIIGHVFFIVLIAMASLFYVERVLCSDSSFQLFKMIVFDKFNIEAGRYSMVIAELLQFIPIKLGLSLNAIIFVYSISFIALFYSIFLLCVYKLKSIEAGIIILLLVIGIRNTFFHAISETWQALVFASLFYAWLRFNETKNGLKSLKTILIFYLISTILIVICVLMHPASLLPLIFIICYHLIDRKLYFNFSNLLFRINCSKEKKSNDR